MTDGSAPDSMEQNQTARVELRVQNSGEIPAENVVVKLNWISLPGVKLQGSAEVRIGEIAPKDVGVAVYTIRTLPTVPPGDSAFEYSISQQEFASEVQKLTLRYVRNNPSPWLLRSNHSIRVTKCALSTLAHRSS